MRVITGSCRGKKLKTLESLDTRPTTDMVKEAVFSIIQFDVPASSVLDLFAGSGQMGIEALSRGASHCVFVDSNPEAVAIVKDNVDSCGFNKESRVLCMDSLEYLKVAKAGLDIVFIDPPYRMGIVERLWSLWRASSMMVLSLCANMKRSLSWEKATADLSFIRDINTVRPL